MVQPPFPFSAHPWPPLTPSASSPCLPPPLHSNSEAYLCNLYNYVTPTLGLTMDQYWTCSDLVPMPRAAIYIPFLHLSYLPDPFSLSSRMRRQLSSHFCSGKVPCVHTLVYML